MALEKDLQAEMDQMRADMARLREDLGAVLTSLKGAGAAKAAHLKEEMSEYASEAEEKAQKILDVLKEKSKAGVQMAGDKVGEHPFITILAAFGAGFVVAKLLDRK